MYNVCIHPYIIHNMYVYLCTYIIILQDFYPVYMRKGMRHRGHAEEWNGACRNVVVRRCRGCRYAGMQLRVAMWAQRTSWLRAPWRASLHRTQLNYSVV